MDLREGWPKLDHKTLYVGPFFNSQHSDVKISVEKAAMKIFFSPIGMYTSFAHWDHIIYARCAHSELELDDDIKNTGIDIYQ